MAAANGKCSRALGSGSIVLMARIVDSGGVAIRRSDVIAIEYSLYEIDSFWPEQLTALPVHRRVSLAIGDVLSDSLQAGRLWAVDKVGFNFRHSIDFGRERPLLKAVRCYEVVYELTMTTGSKANVRFRIGCSVAENPLPGPPPKGEGV